MSGTGATEALSIEDQARLYREALRAAGISTATEWDALPQYRKDRYIRSVEALHRDGYVIARAADVLTPEVKEAIERAANFIEGTCRPDPELPTLPIFSDADLAQLRAAATGGA